MATLEDIAKEAGVSPITVSRIVNGQANYTRPSYAKRAEKIRRLATQMGYRPSSAARAMATQKSMLIGALVMDTGAQGEPFPQPAVYEMMDGLDIGLSEAGYVLCIVNLNDVDDASRRPKIFREQLLDGVVVMSIIPAPVLDLIRSSIPQCIFLETDLWYEENCLRRDEYRAGGMVAEELVARGHEKLVWLEMAWRYPTHHYSLMERRQGFMSKAASLGVPVVQEAIAEMADAAALARQLKPHMNRRTGLAFGIGPMASRVLAAGGALGLVPGEDYTMACCDDSAEIQHWAPQMGRVAFKRFELGKQAASMIASKVQQPTVPCPSVKVCGKWRDGAWTPDRTAG